MVNMKKEKTDIGLARQAAEKRDKPEARDSKEILSKAMMFRMSGLRIFKRSE